MEELTKEQKRRQELEFNELPKFCMAEYWSEEDQDGNFCEQWLPSEKVFYIIDQEHQFRSEAQRKGKWHFYTGYCRKHFKQALKEEQRKARWFNRNTKAKNPQTVKITHIYRVTELDM
jgi:hypothetical protein